MFSKLKYISFEFTDDKDIIDTYYSLLKKSKKEVKKYIYNVDVLELNLSDMFSQFIIDILNKVLILNEIIPNSYLKRKFRLDFEYDEHMAFIDMFLNNNEQTFNKLDKNICDYFKTFPKLVQQQKPSIRIITNYSDEMMME